MSDTIEPISPRSHHDLTDKPDLVMELTNGDGIVTDRAFVTRSSVANASPIWRRMVEPDSGFKPLRRETYKMTQGDQELPVLSLTDDDFKAWLTILEITHLKMGRVLQRLSYQRFLELAKTCDKYNCAELFLPPPVAVAISTSIPTSLHVPPTSDSGTIFGPPSINPGLDIPLLDIYAFPPTLPDVSAPHGPSKQLDWSAFRDQLEMEISHSGGATASDRTNHDAEPKASYKSWKKKYRKLRHKFEGVMKRSDELFKQDLVATATIKRITEENNRLLDLLLDLNSNAHIQHKHYQSIGSPTSNTPPRMMTPDTLQQFQTRKFFVDDPEAGDEVNPDPASISLTVPANAAEPGPEPMDIDPSTSATTAENAQSSNTVESPSQTNPQYTPNGTVHDPSKPLTPPSQPADKPTNRREIPAPEEPAYSPGSTPPRFRETSPFLNPIEDEELPPGTIIHYHQEDSAFTAPSLPSGSPTHPKFPAATNASIPAAATEEEHHWPRNPMSVYCWLRKYQPQVFLQDNEAPGGKERKKKAKRSAEDEEDDHRPGHGPSSPAEPKPKRGGTRISFIGGASEASEGKVSAGTKRRRAQKDEGGEDTPEKEKEPRGSKSKSGSTKPPAAKKPRKSGMMKREED
ncbi:hypothetical protein Dda_8283 [Drechslerella dactyloides]|uniref:Uncharacterized protein n=1 Tax=Drechslerella dactyloides TaxID=74499 RepID=A0AAD6NGI0_DREDA|nr:hypothetical protein Dda_8283 [Drechslerella dactyloides]